MSLFSVRIVARGVLYSISSIVQMHFVNLSSHVTQQLSRDYINERETTTVCISKVVFIFFFYSFKIWLIPSLFKVQSFVDLRNVYFSPYYNPQFLFCKPFTQNLALLSRVYEISQKLSLQCVSQRFQQYRS